MVRKRINKKLAKIESDESDSDDFYEENTEDPQPKKYSLRQRRGANFAEDFDYETLEEAGGNLGATTELLRSDDEEFDAEQVEPEEGPSISKPRASKPKSSTNQNTANTSNCTITKYKERELEPEIPKDKQSSDDMIDFEDVIRADILVNKSRIDYDSIIEKSEIKLEAKKPEEPEIKKTKRSNEKPLKQNGEPPKKRGRKPKKQEVIYDYGNTGLPINTVLGVTESLYELAERYHMQGGAIGISAEMEEIPIESFKETILTESTESNFTTNETENVSLQEPETSVEAIETF